MRRFLIHVGAVVLFAMAGGCASAGRFAAVAPSAPAARADTSPAATVAPAPAVPSRPAGLNLAPTPATPPRGIGVGFVAGWWLAGGGEDLASSHMDGGHAGVRFKEGAIGPKTVGGLKSQLVAEGRFEKEWDGDYALHVLGGWRLTNDTRFKYPYFYEVEAGLLHFPGENVFELHTNFGFIFRKPDRDWAWFARVGLPWAFFEGNTEIGTEFSVGIDFSKKK
jgi:hypothetical protein